MNLDDFKNQSLSSKQLNSVNGGLGTGPFILPEVKEAVADFAADTAEAIWEGVKTGFITVTDALGFKLKD